ncbi:MAG: right-handed parallel beta-helix repeat-containing protein [Spirochaetaceae bacterium]|jgi:hypothetical protein|nr:right-handed parallel beta-helix repeat-containing protein [Spirochaetaceae bacterium]
MLRQGLKTTGLIRSKNNISVRYVLAVSFAAALLFSCNYNVTPGGIGKFGKTGEDAIPMPTLTALYFAAVVEGGGEAVRVAAESGDSVLQLLNAKTEENTAFIPKTTAYKVRLPEPAFAVTLTAQAEEGLTVKYNGDRTFTPKPGSMSLVSVNDAAGNSTLYTIHYLNEIADDPSLETAILTSVLLSSGSAGQIDAAGNFDNGTHARDVDISYGATELSIWAEGEEGAFVSCDKPMPMQITAAETSVTILVSKPGKTVGTYTLTLKKQADGQASRLENVILSAGFFAASAGSTTPVSFAPETTAHYVALPAGTANLAVVPAAPADKPDSVVTFAGGVGSNKANGVFDGVLEGTQFTITVNNGAGYLSTTYVFNIREGEAEQTLPEQRQEQAGLFVGAAASPVAGTGTATFANSMSWLASNAVDNGVYTIVMDANENSAPVMLGGAQINNKSGLQITLKGLDAERTLQLSRRGCLITVDAGVTLSLAEYITLKGRNDNDAPLVSVEGILKLNYGAKITENKGSGVSGSGYIVMNEGRITDIDEYGVYVNTGTFVIAGGEISEGNIGVKLYDGNIIMTGGSIKNMQTGVLIEDGRLLMFNGEISGNSNGGISGQRTTVEINGGKITNNGGTGVYISKSFSEFSAIVHLKMYDGEVSGNGGGGIIVYNGTFDMYGGVIKNNTGITIPTPPDANSQIIEAGIGLPSSYLTLYGYTPDKIIIEGNIVDGLPGNIAKGNSHNGREGYVENNSGKYPPDPATGFNY